MEHKIFLGKYRVAADEMALAAAEPGGDILVADAPKNAVVYRGEEIDSGRDVSVEVIPADSLKDAVREGLAAEALAARKVNHINIPALYDFGVEDDHLIYVTEYLEGTSAEEWVNQHGPMPVGAALRIAHQVVGATGALSFHKISHHAINPGNLMLVPGQTPEGDWPLVKVLHFVGVAPNFSSTDTSVASFDKSSHYASPEQLQHGKVDFRSEIYSLGATMWFLLTGAPPLLAQQGPHAMQPAAAGPAVAKLSGMPKRVRRLLAQMLSVDPEARPQDPLAFYRQIEECLAQVDRRESMARRFGVPVSTNTPVSIPGRRRFPVKALALAAMLLLIAAVAAVMVPSYLRHQRVRQAEEPIGVPIGVPEPVASASSVAANAAPRVENSQPAANVSVASADTSEKAPPPQPEQPADTVQTAQTSSIENRKIENVETIKPLPSAPEQTVPAAVAQQNQPPPVLESAPAASPKQVAVAPVPPPVPAPSDPEPVAPKEVAAAPVQPSITVPADSAPANASKEAAAAPIQPPTSSPPASAPVEKRPVIAANDAGKTQAKTKPVEPAESSVRSKSRETQSDPDTAVASNIPTARPVSPEVRRAEPAPPGEGPEEVGPQNEPEAAPVVTKSVPSEKRTDKARVKTERTAKAKRPLEENNPRRVRVVDEMEISDAPIPRGPDGRIRARFIGVTPEGDWMFALPSKKIVILPPPPGG